MLFLENLDRSSLAQNFPGKMDCYRRWGDHGVRHFYSNLYKQNITITKLTEYAKLSENVRFWELK
jgi:hypothetical protein